MEETVTQSSILTGKISWAEGYSPWGFKEVGWTHGHTRVHIPTRRFPLPQMPITGWQLRFSPSGFKLEVPMILSLSSVNFLVQVTELRETWYLPDYWFTMKGYNSGIAVWKRCRGQGVGKGLSELALPLQ